MGGYVPILTGYPLAVGSFLPALPCLVLPSDVYWLLGVPIDAIYNVCIVDMGMQEVSPVLMFFNLIYKIMGNKKRQGTCAIKYNKPDPSTSEGLYSTFPAYLT